MPRLRQELSNYQCQDQDWYQTKVVGTIRDKTKLYQTRLDIFTVKTVGVKPNIHFIETDKSSGLAFRRSLRLAWHPPTPSHRQIV